MKRSKAKSQPATKLFDHIRELQMRLLTVFAALNISGFIVYFFYEPIIAILRAPLNTTLYYSTPAGSFALIMNICFMGALVVTIPVIAYNIIMFIRPAFKELISIKRIYLMTALSLILSISGVIFAYTIILPGSLNFFSGFKVSELNALISADSYLRFVSGIMITFIVVFQLPIVLSLIDSIKRLTPKKMISYEKWVVLASLIISLVTPFTFDFVTSLLVALPIVVLYNLSILIVIAQHIYTDYKFSTITHATFALPLQNGRPLQLSDTLFESFSTELVYKESSKHDDIDTIFDQINEIKENVVVDDIEVKPKKTRKTATKSVAKTKKKPVAVNKAAQQIPRTKIVNTSIRPEVPAWLIERRQKQMEMIAKQSQKGRVVSDFAKVNLSI